MSAAKKLLTMLVHFLSRAQRASKQEGLSSGQRVCKSYSS